ncbi:hypothetical protein [Actinoplanes flavus]|uniref:Uncharacterized protein n=1 Tax=Actinoplanes flavus TaxID=2820290 RepID=A0ABS3UNE2_9ACTN|nr:hypothetical protein [Actinoplanes flavus]MBO3740287.1 hypothetical protein [Actinoplanes flavus]
MACVGLAQERSGHGLDGAMTMQFGSIVHELLADESTGYCNVCDTDPES